MSCALSQAELGPAITLFQVLFSAIVSVALWRLTAWQRRYEGLEHRLHEATGRVIDERIRAISTQLESHCRSSLVSHEELRQRMSATDSVIATMSERDVKAELALATKLDVLKDYVRASAICKSDLDRYEAAVDRRLNRIETQLQELAA